MAGLGLPATMPEAATTASLEDAGDQVVGELEGLLESALLRDLLGSAVHRDLLGRVVHRDLLGSVAEQAVQLETEDLADNIHSHCFLDEEAEAEAEAEAVRILHNSHLEYRRGFDRPQSSDESLAELAGMAKALEVA